MSRRQRDDGCAVQEKREYLHTTLPIVFCMTLSLTLSITTLSTFLAQKRCGFTNELHYGKLTVVVAKVEEFSDAH